MNTQRIKLIQLFGELLIPLLGYVAWGWNFYFIALFYFLDLVANTVFLYPKLQKFKDFGAMKHNIFMHFTLYVVELALLFYLGLNLSALLIQDFNFSQQSIAFFMLKDMGLPQGFFLLPLVLYAAYMQYKFEFLLPKKYEQIQLKQLLSKHHLGLILSISGIASALALNHFISISEISVVLTLIGLSATYSFFVKR